VDPSRRKPLAAYTTGGAYVNRREHETSSLEVGKAADFAIVDRNPLTVPVHRLGRIRVLNTFVDGEEVYAAPSAAAATSGNPDRPPAATREDRPALARQRHEALERIVVAPDPVR
jgi:cytosine/adenosine deaminase-related metal-dependent hydrolase